MISMISLVYLYGDGLALARKIDYRNRVMQMASSQNLATLLLANSSDLSSIEKQNIKDQITKNTPVEQLVLYVNAPRVSDTEATRDDIFNDWNRCDEQLAAQDENLLKQRTASFVASYGSLLALVSVGVQLGAKALPIPFFQHLGQGLAPLVHQVGGFATNPATLAVTALPFLYFMCQRHQHQKIMSKVNLHKPYQVKDLTQCFKNSPVLQAKLDEIDAAGHVLLQHLSTQKSDDRLRLFLLADDAGRREVLDRYPPGFQQRLNFLFRTYHLEQFSHHALINNFVKAIKIPLDLFEVAALQFKPASTFNREIVEKFKKKRTVSCPLRSNSRLAL